MVTVILNVSDTEADPSLAVTFTAMVPTSELEGVPENVLVEVLKESHEGREEPLEGRGILSGSAIDIGKVLDGT